MNNEKTAITFYCPRKLTQKEKDCLAEKLSFSLTLKCFDYCVIDNDTYILHPETVNPRGRKHNTNTSTKSTH